MEINKIENIDCMEYLTNLPSESVDCILTDPPYNISKDNNFKTMGRSGIDFGEWDKEFNITSWISDAIRVCKKGANIVIFSDWKDVSYIVEELESNKCDIKDLIRIEKSNPIPRNRDRRFVTDYEIAVYAVKKGASWTFNRLSETYERPIIKTSVTPKSQKTHTNHPTQKNEDVMDFLIERLTNENDIILDPFMGSATTAISCIKFNRNYIGCELNEEYYKKSIDRINSIKK